MTQQKSECACLGCGRERFKRSKDGYCIFHARAEDKDEKEFKEALRDYINEIKARDLDYNFPEFVFVGDIHFTDLNVAVFKNARFYKGKFHGEASFTLAEFHGQAFFTRVEFYGEACFTGAKFHGETSFALAEFHEDANFVKAQLVRANISPKSIKGDVFFAQANLENAFLTPLNLDKDARIHFEDAILRNTKIRRKDIEGHIIQERRKDFSGAKESYLLLKNNFHTLGRYDDESWAFQKEKETERKSYFKGKHYPRWAWSKFLSLLYGYGEKPERVVASAALVIVLFAFLFFGFGIERYPWDDLPKRNIAQQVWLGITQGDFITRMHNVPWPHFLNCLYFSGVTFTTLGYGDFRPQPGVSRLIAWIEAFIGAFMIALFIFTFARKTAGR